LQWKKSKTLAVARKGGLARRMLDDDDDDEDHYFDGGDSAFIFCHDRGDDDNLSPSEFDDLSLDFDEQCPFKCIAKKFHSREAADEAAVWAFVEIDRAINLPQAVYFRKYPNESERLAIVVNCLTVVKYIGTSEEKHDRILRYSRLRLLLEFLKKATGAHTRIRKLRKELRELLEDAEAALPPRTSRVESEKSKLKQVTQGRRAPCPSKEPLKSCMSKP
jgi:hypothetical protein